MHLRYVMFGLVKLDPDMSYDTQVRLRKMCTHFIVTKHAHVMEKQNTHTFWRSKMCTHYGEPQKNGFGAWVGK